MEITVGMVINLCAMPPSLKILPELFLQGNLWEKDIYPKWQSRFLLLFQLMLLIVFQMNVIVMDISKEIAITSSVFWEFGFGFVCVCALCQSRKHMYLSKVACKVTSGPRFARELLFLLLVFCDLHIEKETLPAVFTVSLYNLTLQKILNNVVWRKILFNCTMCTNTKRAGYVQKNMADNEQIIPEGIM